jgi:hypothetical protein
MRLRWKSKLERQRDDEGTRVRTDEHKKLLKAIEHIEQLNPNWEASEKNENFGSKTHIFYKSPDGYDISIWKTEQFDHLSIEKVLGRAKNAAQSSENWSNALRAWNGGDNRFGYRSILISVSHKGADPTHPIEIYGALLSIKENPESYLHLSNYIDRIAEPIISARRHAEFHQEYDQKQKQQELDRIVKEKFWRR